MVVHLNHHFFMAHDNDNDFTTDNLYLATALVTAGFKLKHIAGSPPRRAMFVFQNSREIEEATQSFWSNGLKLPAWKLLTTQKGLKDRLYEQARGLGTGGIGL